MVWYGDKAETMTGEMARFLDLDMIALYSCGTVYTGTWYTGTLVHWYTSCTRILSYTKICVY